MTFNKTIALSLVTATILTLTGCGSSDGNDTTTGTSTGTGTDNTIGTNVLFDGPGAADAELRYNANDAVASAKVVPTVKTIAAVTVTKTAAETAAAEVLKGDITADKTLSASTLYRIEGLVKVKNGATLTVEAGTTIFGAVKADYLVVTKGSKIIADGTVEKPITFTSKTALEDASKAAPAQWGGLTVLGNAPTNHTDAAYEVDENEPDFKFGGTVAADNSGILRNIQVLNSGAEVTTDAEINGLSLAGVGSGTVVENILVENSGDDCIEIWGGTVNVTNATLVNCLDDSFDLDYGYIGTATNISVTQIDEAHAGFEISSGGNSPMTAPTIENFSITKVTNSDEGGIYIKDDTTAPTFINGVVKVAGEDKAVHTKKAFTSEQTNKLAFKNVTLK